MSLDQNSLPHNTLKCYFLVTAEICFLLLVNVRVICRELTWASDVKEAEIFVHLQLTSFSGFSSISQKLLQLLRCWWRWRALLSIKNYHLCIEDYRDMYFSCNHNVRPEVTIYKFLQNKQSKLLSSLCLHTYLSCIVAKRKQWLVFKWRRNSEKVSNTF